MQDIYADNPGPHLTPEQVYAAFTPNQTGFADALEGGIFASTYEEALDHFHYARRKYTGDTSKSTYVQPEDQSSVTGYIADKIDAAFYEAVGEIAQSPEALLKLYGKTYDQYRRLARHKGYDLSGDDLARTYFPMRDLYRRAATTARGLGNEEAVKKWQQDWLKYSNGPEEEMRPYDDEYRERKSLYERFLLNKEDGEVWNEVTHRAQHEDERGEIPRYELQTISTSELSDLAGLLRRQTKDEQYAALTRPASNGESWNKVLTTLGDVSLVMTMKRFLEKVVTPEELEAGKKGRLPHAVILGGRDIKAIDQMVFSKNRPANGGHFPANPIAKDITVVESSEALRAVDTKLLADEPHVKLVDGLPTDMPFENRSQDLIVGTRNTEGMDARTLSDFYLELARVLRRGGVYVESNHARTVNGGSFSRWKSLLAQMIVDTVEDRGAIPDRLDADKEAAMLKGLGLTEQIFNLEKRRIRVLVKEGAVKEVGWHALEGSGGVDRLFGIELGGKPDGPKFRTPRQTTRNTVVW